MVDKSFIFISIFNYLQTGQYNGDGGRLINTQEVVNLVASNGKTGSESSRHLQILVFLENSPSSKSMILSVTVFILSSHFFTVKYEILILHIKCTFEFRISSPRFISDTVNSSSVSSILLGHFIFQEFIYVLILSSLVVMYI